MQETLLTIAIILAQLFTSVSAFASVETSTNSLGYAFDGGLTPVPNKENMYSGYASTGMEIHMFIENGKIKSAFPKK